MEAQPDPKTRPATPNDKLDGQGLEYPKVKIEISDNRQISITAHKQRDETQGYYVTVRVQGEPIPLIYVITSDADLLNEFMHIAQKAMETLIFEDLLKIVRQKTALDDYSTEAQAKELNRLDTLFAQTDDEIRAGTRL